VKVSLVSGTGGGTVLQLAARIVPDHLGRESCLNIASDLSQEKDIQLVTHQPFSLTGMFSLLWQLFAVNSVHFTKTATGL
jgi:hypothetical protein